MADINTLSDLKCQVRVILGEAEFSLDEIQKADEDSIVTLNTLAGEPLTVEVNGKPLFKGEVIVVDDQYSIRIVEKLQ